MRCRHEIGALVFFVGILIVAGVAAEVPDYTDVELQVRSNIVDGFNLPPNSSFNSRTPSLNDNGQVAVSLGVVGGDTTTQGIWLGAHGVGSVVYSNSQDGFISDCSVNNDGDVVFELSYLTPDGLYLYDSGAGAGGFLTDQPIGSTGWGSPEINAAGSVGYRASFSGDYAWVSFNGVAVAYHAVMADLDITSPYSYLFTPSFNDSSLIAGKVRLGGPGQTGGSQPDQIRVFASDGSSTLIAEDEDSNALSPFLGFDNSVSLTESGWVGFVAETAAEGRGVYLGNGNELRTIATENDPDVGEIEYFGVSANDGGLVVFRAVDGAGLQTVFVGDGESLVRVVTEHDVVPTDQGPGRIDQHDSSTVFGGSPAINATGQVAISATLTPEYSNQVEWGSGIFVVSSGAEVFSDGFEGGDTSRWSGSVPSR